MTKKRREAALPAKFRVQGISPTGASATIISRVGDLTTIRLDPQASLRAERSMPVDCARAFMRNGLPHLLLAQLDPFRDATLSRILLVRYDHVRFKERVATNEEFRLRVDTLLGARRGIVGEFTELLKAAEATARDQDVASAMLDADFEVMATAGDRGTILFLTGSTLEQHRVAQTGGTQLWFDADLEVTMPTRALADLLLSWKALSEEP